MSWKSCLFHASMGILSYVFLFMGSLGGAAYLLVFRLPKVKEVPEFLDVAQRVRLSFNFFYYLGSFISLTLSLFLGIKKSWSSWSVLAEPKFYSSLILWLTLLIGFFVILIKKRKKKDVGKLLAWACIITFFLALFNLLVGNFIFGGNHSFLRINFF